MERGAQILCVHGPWVSPMRCGVLLAPKTKGSFTAFSSISNEEGRQKQANHCIRISGCSASNQRPTKKAGNGMVLFLSALGFDMIAIGDYESWMTR